MLKVETQKMKVAIDRFVKKSKAKTEKFANEFIQDINEEVVRNTPVMTGFLRGSWYAELNKPPIGQGNIAGVDPSGSVAVSRLNLTVANMKLGDTYYAVNGAKYAVYVEYGTTRMAPRAFVRKTLSRAQSIANETARRIAAED